MRVAKSINYYPSDAGWSAMWTGFDPARVDADMAKAAAAGTPVRVGTLLCGMRMFDRTREVAIRSAGSASVR